MQKLFEPREPQRYYHAIFTDWEGISRPADHS